jgi:hypothetical protein
MVSSRSMYSITENIYYSRLSSVAILLQPEHVSHRIIQGKDCVPSPYVLSSCGLPFPFTCLLLTVNEARSYFASTIPTLRRNVLPPSLALNLTLYNFCVGTSR